MTATERDRYTVTVEEYAGYGKDGFLIVRGLLPKEDVSRLQAWMSDIYEGRVNLDHLSPVFDWMTDRQKADRLASARLHMPHWHSDTAEWGLLHPRVLDVLEALIGPDVSALQSMLFFNPPKKGGQGWHQDSYYIQTQPDSLIGVWMAVDRADEENGCLWVAPGSHREPIYPPVSRAGYVHADDRHIQGLFHASHASHMDDSINKLSEIAAKYGEAVPVPLEPGDVLFFHSHLLHRSYRNGAEDRFRRSYVCHYCNARSWVPWNHGAPYDGEAANAQHILARGRTHLPFASPKFGTPVELTPAAETGAAGGTMMVAMPDGGMGKLEM
jgi:phytanoyl-CoA hydroxylase